ncbi:hypothetical protein K402DRAFT_89830 [Aulographum hederae CBS 113979]|uniref:Nonsense-mediated mRNA decay factor n=1 Tax=Aulographum hederae CBS 113979 TaxID=1176131 RepID=A0A6G1GZW9_9PEZI|nr:hypothetical protein K402DRAFT_89830 [Aulographum hederae CBS 113979]
MESGLAKAVEYVTALQSSISARCKDANVPLLETVADLPNIRSAALDALSIDFGKASQQHIEERLWDAHKKISDRWAKELYALLQDNTEKDKEVAVRKHGAAYLRMIKDSQKFYRGLVLSVDQLCGGIPELRKTAQAWTSQGKSSVATDGRFATETSSGLESLALQTCYNILVHLGDFSRYRHEAGLDGPKKDDKKSGLGSATGYYNLATAINPYSGIAYNQQAVVARLDNSDLRALYHRYRALVATKPHPAATNNLELGFSKIEKALKQPPRDARDPAALLKLWFVRLHCKLYFGAAFPEHLEMEREVINRLEGELKRNAPGNFLFHMTLVNMASEYTAVERLRGGKTDADAFRSRDSLSRLNIKTFSLLLDMLKEELRKLPDPAESDSTAEPANVEALAKKLSEITKRILPAVRLYSSWLIANREILAQPVSQPETNELAVQLWGKYANTMTELWNHFPPEQFVNALAQPSVMLEEDVETLGFLPLTGEDSIKDRWFVNGVSKVKFSDAGAPDLSKEMDMMMRIRDLLLDGASLHRHDSAPITLRQGRFEYETSDQFDNPEHSEAVEANRLSDHTVAEPPPQGDSPPLAQPAQMPWTPPKDEAAKATAPYADALPTSAFEQPATLQKSVQDGRTESNDTPSAPLTVNDFLGRVLNPSQYYAASPRQEQRPPHRNSENRPETPNFQTLPNPNSQSSIWTVEAGTQSPANRPAPSYPSFPPPPTQNFSLGGASQRANGHLRQDSRNSASNTPEQPSTWSPYAPTPAARQSWQLPYGAALTQSGGWGTNQIPTHTPSRVQHNSSMSLESVMDGPILYGLGQGPWNTAGLSGESSRRNSRPGTGMSGNNNPWQAG